MKKILCCTIGVVLSCFAVAQDSAWRHVNISVIPRVLSTKINVEVDYEQDTKFLAIQE